MRCSDCVRYGYEINAERKCPAKRLNVHGGEVTERPFWGLNIESGQDAALRMMVCVMQLLSICSITFDESLSQLGRSICNMIATWSRPVWWVVKIHCMRF